jgi:hypothetical protein
MGVWRDRLTRGCGAIAHGGLVWRVHGAIVFDPSVTVGALPRVGAMS